MNLEVKKSDPVLRTDQSEVGGTKDPDMTVMTESVVKIKTVRGIVLGVDGNCSKRNPGLVTKPEHLSDKGRCNTPAPVFGQDGKRVKVELSLTCLIIHILIVVTYVHPYERKCDVTHAAVSGPIVGHHHTDRYAIIESDRCVAPAVKGIGAAADMGHVLQMLLTDLINMQRPEHVPGYESGVLGCGFDN